MMTRTSLAFASAILLLLSAACGTAGDATDPDGSPSPTDASPPDAIQSPADADPARCADLRFSLSEGEVTAAALRFVDNIRAHGANNAYLNSPPDGTQSQLYLMFINVDLAVDPGGDPGPAILAWFGGIAESPIRPAEYRALLDAGGTRLTLLRETIDGVPFPTGAPGDPDWAVPGLTASVTKLSDGWRIQTASLRPFAVFATREDAVLQRDCTPSGPPPEAPLRAHTFDGRELTYCSPDGEYHYTPNSLDRIVWLAEGTVWLGTRRTTSEPSERSVWVPSRRLELTIDPSNYWERIAHADCYCPGGRGDAGFTVVVHALTGDLLRWWPGINCVVC